jgi:hypothetical protein
MAAPRSFIDECIQQHKARFAHYKLDERVYLHRLFTCQRGAFDGLFRSAIARSVADGAACAQFEITRGCVACMDNQYTVALVMMDNDAYDYEKAGKALSALVDDYLSVRDVFVQFVRARYGECDVTFQNVTVVSGGQPGLRLVVSLDWRATLLQRFASHL